MKYSSYIENFNNFLNKVTMLYKENFNIIIEKEKEESDLLHELELAKYENSRRVGGQLRKVLKERRKSKDIVEILKPLIDYINKNKKACNELTEILGAIRKEEKSHLNRYYIPKIRGDLTINTK